ncbi:helix-turn-helix domain-containing protein [Kordia algicida OT-1]|uniref:helix-turn-helix domain-containing protein n=1 Tax=Kordia algicida TaxID=221066 RepID=UPI001389AD48|nr:helix-turn-helix domain-containing protein [Kordia algicida]
MKNTNNDTLYAIYSQYYIDKAIKEKDTQNIVRGYYLITLEDKDEYAKYLDSLVKYSKLTNHDYFLWNGFYGKGRYYKRKRNFQQACEYYIKAYKLARKINEAELLDISVVSLGLVRERIGKHNEALKDYKKSYLYTKELINDKLPDSSNLSDFESYLHSLNLLANSYRLNSILDSAKFYNREVLNYENYSWSKEYVNKASLNMSEIFFDEKRFELAIKYASKTIPLFSKSNNLKSIAASYYIIGMSEIKLDNESIGISYLTKMDSIFNLENNLYPPLRSAYETLIIHYKKKNDLKKQLYYTEQIIKFDSIVFKDYQYISEGITQKLDRPELLEQKKILENKLKKSNNKIYLWIIFVFILLALLGYETYRRKKLTKRYLEKFDNLIKQIDQNKNNKEPKKLSKTLEINTNESLGINIEVVENILKSLSEFELLEEYTDSNLTATSLAKKIGTNANYLGRVIKYKYDLSFRNYINNLRINLALDKLRNTKEFKKFSVYAMAKEVGFKNSEPFSKAFKGRTGNYPSEFIEKLKN